MNYKILIGSRQDWLGRERRTTGESETLLFLPLAKAFGEQSFSNESLIAGTRRLSSLGRCFAFGERQGEIRIVDRRTKVGVPSSGHMGLRSGASPCCDSVVRVCCFS